jgi:hypothetical protein
MVEILHNHSNFDTEHSIEISFGLLFTPVINGCELNERVNVITNLGSGNNFGAHLIVKDNDNQWCIPAGAGGTAGIENVGAIIGQLNPEQVVYAYRLGIQKAGIPESDSGLNFIITNSIQNPRIIY